MRQCSVDGCDKAHRARGLCATHYNQQHQPNRHAKVELPCDYCGQLTFKSPTTRWAGRYCSYLCRDLHRIEQAPDGDCMAAVRGKTSIGSRGPRGPRLSRLPGDHPARWYGTSCPVSFDPCAWCGALFCRGRPAGGLAPMTYCTHRCKMASKRARRRGREFGDFGYWTWSDFMHIAHRFGFRCAYCGVKPDGQLDPDHVVPLSKGGPNTIANLLPSCRACNSDKRDLLLEDWDADRLRRGLAPRATSWPAEDTRYVHLTAAIRHHVA